MNNASVNKFHFCCSFWMVPSWGVITKSVDINVLLGTSLRVKLSGKCQRVFVFAINRLQRYLPIIDAIVIFTSPEAEAIEN